MNAILILFSPCSGLAVSGYSKRDKDVIRITSIFDKALEPYKRFRKMYKVEKERGTTFEFEGILQVIIL